MEFIATIKKIISATEAHKGVLKNEYRFSGEQVIDLKNDLDNFREMEGQPWAY